VKYIDVSVIYNVDIGIGVRRGYAGYAMVSPAELS